MSRTSLVRMVSYDSSGETEHKGGFTVEELKDKLRQEDVSEDAIALLENAGMLTAKRLRAANADQLVNTAGLKLGDALAVKEAFPSQSAASGPEVPREIRLIQDDKPHEMSDLDLILAVCQPERKPAHVDEAESRFSDAPFWAKADDGTLVATASQEAWQYWRDNRGRDMPTEWDNIPLYSLRDALDRKRYAHPRTGRELPKGRGWGQVPVDRRILANLYFLTVDASEWADDATLIRELTSFDEGQLAQDVRWGSIVSLFKRTDSRSRRLQSAATERLYVEERGPFVDAGASRLQATRPAPDLTTSPVARGLMVKRSLSLDEYDLRQYVQRLEIHRRNLVLYRQQEANFGTGYVPPAIANGIIQAEEEIRRMEGYLYEPAVPQQPMLYELISEYFSLGEMRALCADLGFDYEDIRGETKDNKALSLVEYCERRRHTGLFDRLLIRLQELRPRVDWPAARDVADQINAQGSQGYINRASGPINQNFGSQTNVNTGGGDYSGGNMDKRRRW